MSRRWTIIIASTVACILFFTVFGERGLLHIHHLKEDHTLLDTQLKTIRKENEQLKREIEALRSDRQYLETIARRDFGLVKPGEVVYRFMTSSQQINKLPARPAPGATIEAKDIKN